MRENQMPLDHHSSFGYIKRTRLSHFSTLETHIFNFPLFLLWTLSLWFSRKPNAQQWPISSQTTRSQSSRRLSASSTRTAMVSFLRSLFLSLFHKNFCFRFCSLSLWCLINLSCLDLMFFACKNLWLIKGLSAIELFYARSMFWSLGQGHFVRFKLPAWSILFWVEFDM